MLWAVTSTSSGSSDLGMHLVAPTMIRHCGDKGRVGSGLSSAGPAESAQKEGLQVTGELGGGKGRAAPTEEAGAGCLVATMAKGARDSWVGWLNFGSARPINPVWTSGKQAQ